MGVRIKWVLTAHGKHINIRKALAPNCAEIIKHNDELKIDDFYFKVILITLVRRN